MVGVSMKTRIVYPKLWLDDKFPTTTKETKVLFNYLINCNSLGLTRYQKVTARQIMFDTGLTANELETGKRELIEMKWCFFKDNWVYHNHDCAYVSYEGRDRLIESKAREINAVPQKIKDYFNPLITRYEPDINNKSEIINNKSNNRGVNKEEVLDVDEIAEGIERAKIRN
jgi:hypothetical protein